MGDGIIQEAVIQNLRRCFPAARIIGVTLFPERTESIHGIPSFPATGFSRRFYAVEHLVSETEGKTDIPSLSGSVKRRLKNMEFIFSPMKKIMAKLHVPVAIAKSIHAFIAEIFREPVHIIKTFNFLKDVEVLIFSGGGQIDDYWGGAFGQPYAMFKWAVLSKLRGKKIIFLSIGACSLDSILSRIFIRYSFQLADYRSFRDHESKNMLKGFRFISMDPVFPDLAFSYIPGTPGKGSKGDSVGKTIIGISPIAYLSERWPRNNPSVFHAYIQALSELIGWFLKGQNSISLFTTDSMDQHVSDKIMKNLQASGVEHGKIENRKIRSFDELSKFLMETDYVVASRLHGVILAHIANKPVLGISYDRKVNTYMSEMDQMEYCVDIHSVETDSLIAAYKKMVENEDEIREHIRKKVSINIQNLEFQYQNILT